MGKRDQTPLLGDLAGSFAKETTGTNIRNRNCGVDTALCLHGGQYMACRDEDGGCTVDHPPSVQPPLRPYPAGAHVPPDAGTGTQLTCS